MPDRPQPPGQQKQLGQILKEMELVSEGQIQEALVVQRQQGGVIGEILISLEYVVAEEVLLALAVQSGTPIDHFDVLKFEPLPEKEMPPDAGGPGDAEPIVELLDLIFRTALNTGATAIHLDAVENRIDVRYQVDGLLYEMESPPAHLAAPILDRVKRQTGLDPARSEWPQTNQVLGTLAGRRYRVDVSSQPAAGGESLVLQFSPL